MAGKAASQGFVNASYQLGKILTPPDPEQYFGGLRFFQDFSYKKASGFFRHAAENGHADAQYKLGSFLLNGKIGFGGIGEKYLDTVPANFDSPIEWLLRQ